MESSGAVPRNPVDLDDLGVVCAGAGPFLNVYLVTDGKLENAALRTEQRWKTLRRRLADEGAPETALALVDPLVRDAHLEGATLAVFGDAARTLLVDHLGEPLNDDRGSWGPLPDLAPLIRWRQSQVPYVLALADRGGADLIADRPGGAGIERVAGDAEPERKVSPGGWSQRRYQQRAENDWERTAGDVATQVAKLSEQVDARVIVLGGDVRATHMIRDDLPARLTERTHLIDPGRAADGSEEARDREVRRLLATAVSEDTVALLQRFKEERGQHDRAVEGAAATVDALNQAAVDVLFVHDDGEEDRPVWVGPQPVPISLDRDAGVLTDGSPPTKARLTDALVRAAIGTGASVRIIPGAGPVTDGIGALLRWSSST
jgi:hypothetical protein